jgi:hypothetical protein
MNMPVPPKLRVDTFGQAALSHDLMIDRMRSLHAERISLKQKVELQRYRSHCPLRGFEAGRAYLLVAQAAHFMSKPKEEAKR